MSNSKVLEFLNSEKFKKYFFNTSWLMLTQGVRLLTGFFVGLWLARFLEPTNYGIYNYVIAIVAILMTFNKFGTEDILVRNLLTKDEKSHFQLNSAFYLRLFMALFTISVVGIYCAIHSFENIYANYVFICSFGFIFHSFEVIDIFNRATVQIKYSSLVRVSQIILSSILKIYFIVNRFPLEVFFYLFVFDAVSYSLPIYLSYRRKQKDFLCIPFQIKKIKSLILTCYPIMIGSILTIVLSKVESFSIPLLMDEKSLGLYSSAYRIVELASLVSILVLSSLFTAIVNAKRVSEEVYLLRFKNLSRALVFYGLVAALILYVFSYQIIRLLYGSDYLEAEGVLRYLSIHIVSLTLMSLNIQWFIAEGLNRLVMLKTFCALITNIALNFLLIPKFGLNGAVLSTVATHIFFFYVVDAFFKRTRAIFFINSSLLIYKVK